MEQVAMLSAAPDGSFVQSSTSLNRATEASSAGGAMPSDAAAIFAATSLPNAPQLDPIYEPVLPYLAR
jgi:hypothetical protein